jgi:hypothetical protein
MARGGNHLGRLTPPCPLIADARFRRRNVSGAQFRENGAISCRFARATARIPAALYDRYTPAARQRLSLETRGDVEHLVERLRADDSRLVKERVDAGIAGRQRRRVAAGGARAGIRPPGLDADNRLDPADPPRELCEPARVERLEYSRMTDVGIASQCSRSLPETSASFADAPE